MKTFQEFINEAALSNYKKTLINQIHTKIGPMSKGIFSDTDWGAVRRVWEEIKAMGLDLTVMDNAYQHDNNPVPNPMPTSKTWTFIIKFVNQKGNPDTIHGRLVASGAGTVAEPMSRYDITVMMS